MNFRIAGLRKKKSYNLPEKEMQVMYKRKNRNDSELLTVILKLRDDGAMTSKL